MRKNHQIKEKIITYLAFLTDRLAAYLFPIFLITIEWFLRSALNISTQEFIGPTLAAAGAGMLVSLTNYTSVQSNRSSLSVQLTPEVQNFINQNNLQLRPVGIDKVRVFINLSWILTLSLIVLWIWSVKLATQKPDLFWLQFPAHYYPGAMSYAIGVAASEIKEAV